MMNGVKLYKFFTRVCVRMHALLSCVLFVMFCFAFVNNGVADVKTAKQVVNKATTTAKKTASNAKAPAKVVEKAKKDVKKAVDTVKKEVSKVTSPAPKKVEFKTLPNLSKSTLSKKPTPTKVQQKKKIKTKQVVIDCKIVAFARTASDAESAADAKTVSLSSGKIKPLIKDTTFLTDTTGRVGCMKRMNYTDTIPENWYLETQMVVGFSSRSYEQAYNDAVQRSSQKVKSIVEKNNLGNKVSDGKKSPSVDKVIAYDYGFAKSGKEYYCRLFFRYMMPKN